MTDDHQLNDEYSDTDGADLAAEALVEAENAVAPSTSSAVSSTAKPTGQALVDTLNALQSIIERNASELDRIKEELSQTRESIKNVLDNDDELTETAAQVEAANIQIKQRKAAVMSSAQVTQLKTKAADLNEQKKEIEETLNNHLLNLFQVTGTKVYDTSSGEQREFNVRASLKSAKAKKDA